MQPSNITYKGWLNLLNIKILLAPVLAIGLALFLAGAINSLMLPTDIGVHVQPTPQPSSLSTPPPVASAAMGSSISFIIFIVGTVLVGIVAVLLFFREKNLTKCSANNL